MKFLVAVVVCMLSLGALAKDGEGRNGGFADDSARIILNKTSKNLATLISEYSGEAVLRAFFIDYMGGVPEGINFKEMADVLGHVKESPNTTRFRDGRELMFDYGRDENGKPYIEALQKFYIAYLPYTEDQITTNLVNSLMAKLLHEYSHFWGYDDEKAKIFGRRFSLLLRAGDKIICHNPFGNFTIAFERHGQDANRLDYSDSSKISNEVFLEYAPNGDGNVNNGNLKEYIFQGKLLAFKKSSKRFSGKLELKKGSSRSTLQNVYEPNLELIPFGEATFDVKMDSTFLKGEGVIQSSSLKEEAKFECKHSAFELVEMFK